MRYVMRRYAGEDDFWAVRGLLRRLLVEADFLPATWGVLRWDYWRWHGVLNCGSPPPEELVTLVEDDAGALIGLINAEDRGEAFLQLDPRARSDALEEAMLTTAEERLSGEDELLVWAPASQQAWAALLGRHGYGRTDDDEHVRMRSLLDPLPRPEVAPGYRIRALAEGDADFPARGDISLRVFHPVPDGNTAMTGAEYRNIQRCPLYRRDLDLVAESDDGSLAAFVTVWFDDVLRTATIEPAGTDAPHRRRGLGRALLLEGMARARWMGATRAYVGSYGAGAHALYESVGLQTAEHLVGWRRPA
jgi:GNAT superfamily N-acetyltransferase